MIKDVNGELIEIVRVVHERENTDIVLATDGALHVVKVKRKKKPVERKMNLPQAKPSLERAKEIRMFRPDGTFKDYASVDEASNDNDCNKRSIYGWLKSEKVITKDVMEGYRFVKILGE